MSAQITAAEPPRRVQAGTPATAPSMATAVTSAAPAMPLAVRPDEDAQALRWDDVLTALALLVVDGPGLGGAVIRAGAGPVQTQLVAALRAGLAADAPWLRVPSHVDDERLLGGLDLTATLRAGRPIIQRGLLAQADGGVLALPMAERLSAGQVGRLCAVMDDKAVWPVHAAASSAQATAFTVLALDESVEDESVHPALLDRLALLLDVHDLGLATADVLAASTGQAQGAALPWSAHDLLAARAALGQVTLPPLRADEPRLSESGLVPADGSTDDRQSAPHAAGEGVDLLQALCEAAWALGITSLRVPLFALRAARARCALDGRHEVAIEDLQFAARMVLAPRAKALPAGAGGEPGSDAPPPEDQAQDHAQDAQDTAPDEPQEQAQEQAPDDREPASDSATEADQKPADEEPEEAAPELSAQDLQELILAAAQAAIPPGLLARLKLQAGAGRQARRDGRGAGVQRGAKRGRPQGARPGDPARGARLDLVATLRAAAPWQAVRRRERGPGVRPGPTSSGKPALQQLAGGTAAGVPAEGVTTTNAIAASPRRGLDVRREDLHIKRMKQRRGTTTLFVVDASGSAALHRLAEAKGAVELMLAECYVRRDQVAMMAFRGAGAELLLPPTRSLARAKRSLAGLPGGGGTPLASALDAARDVADGIQRRGETAVVVWLSDGRANLGRSGQPGREQAQQDAMSAARLWRELGASVLWLDTSAQPQAHAQRLAEAMGAVYLPLPLAGSAALSQVIRQAVGQPASGS